MIEQAAQSTAEDRATGPSQNNGARIVVDQRRATAGPGPKVMSATTLEGDKVVNSTGKISERSRLSCST
jgi:hypothetical protein